MSSGCQTLTLVMGEAFVWVARVPPISPMGNSISHVQGPLRLQRYSHLLSLSRLAVQGPFSSFSSIFLATLSDAC